MPEAPTEAGGHLLQMNQIVGSKCGHRRHGATAARLTPDQKVGSSNLSGLIWPAGWFSLAEPFHGQRPNHAAHVVEDM